MNKHAMDTKNEIDKILTQNINPFINLKISLTNYTTKFMSSIQYIKFTNYTAKFMLSISIYYIHHIGCL